MRTDSVPQRSGVVVFVAAVLLVTLAAGGAWADTPIKIMPLGDSITQGGRQNWDQAVPAANATTLGYRYHLWERLRDAGVAFNFVGNVTTPHTPDNNPSGNPADTPNLTDYPEYYTNFDRNHEGHWGTTAVTVNTDSNNNNNIQQFLDLLGAANRPDIVIIHLGTNDLRNKTVADVPTILGYVQGIVEEIRNQSASHPGANANAKIVLTTIDNTISNYGPGVLNAFNDGIRNFANTLDTANSPVYLVDLAASAYDPNKNLANPYSYDGTHMAKRGEDLFADLIYDALVSNNLIPEPTSLALLAGGTLLLVRRRRTAA